MRSCLCFLSIAVLIAAYTHAEHVVCYYGSWAGYRNSNGKCDIGQLDPHHCTVLIYGFAGLSAKTNEIVSLDAYNDLTTNWGKGGYKRFNELRKLNPKLKTLIAIGGWNEGSFKYSNMAANSESRKTFVKSVLKFISTHGFNGLDLDWEYPASRGGVPADKQNFVKLIKELREEFDRYGYLLTAAVGAGTETIDRAYDVPNLSKYLDFINVMTYDFHGSWQKNVGHNAPLYARPDESAYDKLLNLNASIHHFIKRGAAPHKLILGMGSYGQAFTLVNPKKNAIFAPALGPGKAGPYTRQAGMLGYNEICEKMMKESWTVIRDEHYKAPYAYSGDQWVGYDDVQSIKAKSHFAKALGLGGGMLWSMETDDFKGICGKKYPLLRAISEVMQSKSQTKTFEEQDLGLQKTPLRTEVRQKVESRKEAEVPEELEVLVATVTTTTITPTTTTTTPTTMTTTTPTTTTTTPTTTTTTPTTTPTTTTKPKTPITVRHAPLTIATAKKINTDRMTAIKSQCTPNGFVRHPKHCSTFYKCDLAKPNTYNVYRFKCQRNLYFDINTNSCNWKSLVKDCN